MLTWCLPNAPWEERDGVLVMSVSSRMGAPESVPASHLDKILKLSGLQTPPP